MLTTLIILGTACAGVAIGWIIKRRNPPTKNEQPVRTPAYKRNDWVLVQFHLLELAFLGYQREAANYMQGRLLPMNKFLLETIRELCKSKDRQANAALIARVKLLLEQLQYTNRGEIASSKDIKACLAGIQRRLGEEFSFQEKQALQAVLILNDEARQMFFTYVAKHFGDLLLLAAGDRSVLWFDCADFVDYLHLIDVPEERIREEIGLYLEAKHRREAATAVTNSFLASALKTENADDGLAATLRQIEDTIASVSAGLIHLPREQRAPFEQRLDTLRGHKARLQTLVADANHAAMLEAHLLETEITAESLVAVLPEVTDASEGDLS